MTKKDKKILEYMCKKYLLDVAVNSPLIKERLSFPQHIKLCETITTLNFDETISIALNEDPREFESKFGRFLKYSFAQIAGLVGGGAVAGVGGIVVAPPLAMFILYRYRKANSICHLKCKGDVPLTSSRKICRYQCETQNCVRIANEIKREMSRCSTTKKPDKCKQKLQKQYIIWAQRAKAAKTKLMQAQMAHRKKNVAHDVNMRNQQIEDSFNIKTNDLLKIIYHSPKLRNKLTFKEQLKLYYKHMDK